MISKRILLIEDDPKDIELTVNALSENDLANDILIARDGVEALDCLYCRGAFAQRSGGNPVVILMDLKMPKMDGIQVLKQIKSDENLCMIPVVILTSSRESRDLEACYKFGANAYVVKPVRFQQFVETIKAVGIYWKYVNEPPPDSSMKAS
jgi:CheY-like chemotaxis protein